MQILFQYFQYKDAFFLVFFQQVFVDNFLKLFDITDF